MIQKVLVYCNAIKFGLCSPTFEGGGGAETGELKLFFIFSIVILTC